jgi:hypothetical protein
MKKTLYFFLLALTSITLFTSCDPEEAEEVNEEELITTVIYTLTPQGGGNAVVLKFTDKDGAGGTAPTIQGGTLDLGKTYNGTVTLLNEAATPSVDITTEVAAEAVDHQFFYSTTTATITYDDKDGKNLPIGIKTLLKPSKASTGNVKITLRHKPNKSATGVKEGDITNAGGETDIEVNLPLEVK